MKKEMRVTYFSMFLALPILGMLSGCSFQAEQPNIVFILADDMGHSDPGCYGAEILETPNIDELAGNFEHMEPVLEQAMRRIPALEDLRSPESINEKEHQDTFQLRTPCYRAGNSCSSLTIRA